MQRRTCNLGAQVMSLQAWPMPKVTEGGSVTKKQVPVTPVMLGQETLTQVIQEQAGLIRDCSTVDG